MTLQISNVADPDLAELHALNASEVPHVGEVDIERMRWFAENADYFRIARIDDEIVGFLVGLLPGSDYQSPNYRWFNQRYIDFAYVDRIIVAESARGLGVASDLYADFATQSQNEVRVMTCEVNILPPNEGSMQFHTSLGFRKVGTLTSDDGQKKVGLLLKDL